MKIGLFGGTFNPFHNGHIGITRHVLETYGLNRVYFIPSATPPHKPGKNLVPANDRFHMVRSSLEAHEALLVSDKELHRKGPSYTIDTIRAFKADFHPSTRFYLLMGSDAFLDISTWKSTGQLFEAVRMVIMLRGDWTDLNEITAFIDERISKGYTYSQETGIFYHETLRDICICRVPKIDISSTLVRKRVKAGQPIHDLVPEPVERMIRTKDYYL